MAVRPPIGFSRKDALAFLILCCTATARPQGTGDRYLVRVARENLSGTSCVLLETTGAFHYETGDVNHTSVYEGELSADQMNAVREMVQKVSVLSQTQIEEPLLPGTRDLLDIHLFVKPRARELLFRSAESQQPYAAEIKPVLGWMYGLAKLPHRELSEDAGKRNCLPRGRPTLITRDQVAPQPPLQRVPTAGRRIAPPSRPPAPTLAAAPPLVRLKLLEKSTSTAKETCALIENDGGYRFEARSQKLGSVKTENRTTLGQLTPESIDRLRELLDAPALAKISHHEAPDDMPLRINGSVLELYISRQNGIQTLVLTDSTHRNTFFYAGDADISKAAPLLKFVKLQFEKAASETKGDLNGCTQLGPPND